MLALAGAQERLGKPGRPRKARPVAESPHASIGVQAVRLLDVAGVAAYLSVSVRIVHELRAAGHLRPVVLPLGGRELRRLLFDRLDVDALIEANKVAP